MSAPLSLSFALLELPRTARTSRYVAVVWRFTTWDGRVLLRAAIVAALAFALAWLLTAATDEGGISWGERAGRTLPLVPACSALGVWAALAPAARRGEARALASLGRSHMQIASAALAGAALVASVAAIAVAASRRIDVDGFFPTATHAQAWRYDGEVFIDDARGLIVGNKGAITRRPAADARAARARDMTPLHGRTAAALATALYGLALPLLLAFS